MKDKDNLARRLKKLSAELKEEFSEIEDINENLPSEYPYEFKEIGEILYRFDKKTGRAWFCKQGVVTAEWVKVEEE